MNASGCFRGLKYLTSVDQSITTEHYSSYRTYRTTQASLECGTCLFRSYLFFLLILVSQTTTEPQREREGVGETETKGCLCEFGFVSRQTRVAS